MSGCSLDRGLTPIPPALIPPLLKSGDTFRFKVIGIFIFPQTHRLACFGGGVGGATLLTLISPHVFKY